VPGSALAPSGTTAAFTASFSATVNFQYSSGTATPTTAVPRTFTTIPSKTIERRTNALRILVVPMGNSDNSYAAEFPSEAVAAVENGMQTLSRIFPVPSGVGTLGSTTGGIRYAITPTLLDVETPFCGSAGTFDAIKAQLAQFLVSWNATNPNAQADRVVGAVAGSKSLGGGSGCPEGMASLISPEAWVRALPDATNTVSMTGALFAMEVAHTFGLVPESRSFGTFHSLSTAADGTSPNRGYNVALRSFLSDDRNAMLLSGTWNNTTTILEKADYAYLLCVLGGQTNTECTTSAVAGSSTGVGALATAFAVTGHTDGLTEAGTQAQESFVAVELQGRGTDENSEYKLIQRDANDGIVQTDGVRVSFTETHHDDEPAVPLGTFAPVVALNVAAEKFELRNGAGILLWSAIKIDEPEIDELSVLPGGLRNFTNTTSVSEFDASLTSDENWLAYARAGGGIYVASTSDPDSAINVPFPVIPGGGENGDVLYSGFGKLFVDDPFDAAGPTEIYDGSADGISPHDPEWSPDGTKIVFSGVKGSNWDIYVFDTYKPDDPPVRLTTDTLLDTKPTWSQKGQIVFVRGPLGGGSETELYSVLANGTGELRLTDDSEADDNPEASPDGNLIAWQSGCGEAGAGWNVCRMAIDGTGPKTNLTAGLLGNALSPEWSPDGEQIAFHLFFFPFGPTDVDIYRIEGANTETPGAPQDVVTSTGVAERNVQWSGDGQDIIFEQFDGETTSFATIAYHGDDTAEPVGIAGLTDWAFEPKFASGPAWGSSTGAGAKLAFVYGLGLYTVGVNLSGDAPVFGDPVLRFTGGTIEGPPGPLHPTWSPDESTLAYQDNAFPSDIHLCPLAGGDCQSTATNITGSFDPAARHPSWATDGSNLIAFDAPGTDSSDIRVINPAAITGGVGLFQADGVEPSWRADGGLAFGRSGDIWLFDPATDEASMIFEDGGNPSIAGDKYAFERATAFAPPGCEFDCGITDIMVGSPDSGVTVNVRARFDSRLLNPAGSLRLDLIVDCGTLKYVVAVALKPISINLTTFTATWVAHFDPSLTCANPVISVAVSDGYNRVPGTSDEEIQPEERPPTAAIYTPTVESTFLEYDLVPARGGGWDAEDGALPDGGLEWTLVKDGGGFSETGTGSLLDFSPPPLGFPLGDYTLTLKVTDSAGLDDTATTTFTIVEDADHDGIPVGEDKVSCAPGAASGDDNPLNSFADYDGDGFVNVDDDGAICIPSASYEATIDVDPAVTNAGAFGVLTAIVKLDRRSISDVNGATVKIVSINGIDADISAIRWTVDKKSGAGIAKFDRSALLAFFEANDIHGGLTFITIQGTGSSGGPPWTFQGADTTLVQ
jgi:Tol biopolymer transport system component